MTDSNSVGACLFLCFNILQYSELPPSPCSPARPPFELVPVPCTHFHLWLQIRQCSPYMRPSMRDPSADREKQIGKNHPGASIHPSALPWTQSRAAPWRRFSPFVGVIFFPDRYRPGKRLMDAIITITHLASFESRSEGGASNQAFGAVRYCSSVFKTGACTAKSNVLISKTADLPNWDVDLAGPVSKPELPNGPLGDWTETNQHPTHLCSCFPLTLNQAHLHAQSPLLNVIFVIVIVFVVGTPPLSRG